MTFNEAVQLALAGQVHELALTHFSPSIYNPEEYKDRAESAFKNSIIGFDRFVRLCPLWIRKRRNCRVLYRCT